MLGMNLKTFEDLNLDASIRRALDEENYETPTPIQARTIPSALEGRDILGCAQTGTGKTAAFALPILNALAENPCKARPNQPLVLVLAPTRELAIQIGDSFGVYGKYLRMRHVLVYGGVNQANQVRALNRGAHVLVATPGRLLDLMNQGHISLSQLEAFVLDEADRMLDMGFLPDIKRIIKQLPSRRQSMFFSATLAPNIVELSRRLLHDPVSVNVTPKSTSVERIDQRVLFVEKRAKATLLKSILSGDEVQRTLVFTKTKRAANLLVGQLLKGGFTAAAIHGNKSQNARQRALEAFRVQEIQVLVATDVASRGIDIDGITHVVNFDLPLEPENYVHRIGRTARAGAEGIALSFCSPAERGDLRAIERLIGQKVPVDSGQTNHQSRNSDSNEGRETDGTTTGNSKESRPRKSPTETTNRSPRSRSSNKPRVTSNSNRLDDQRSAATTPKDNEEKPKPRRRRRRKRTNRQPKENQTT
jgi:ATP-dependent RNA helicase RhlE